jgi:hypothetical protein
MGGELKAEEELERAKEDGGSAPGSEVGDRREELPRERRPDQGRGVEALAGEGGRSFHGDDTEQSQVNCHRSPGRL